MPRRLLIAALALVLPSVASSASCPIEPWDVDKIEAAIDAKPTCKAAYDLLIACQRTTSGDVGPAQRVIAKCEGAVVTRSLDARSRAYSQEREACRKKYAGKQGTMYVSFQAICEAQAAVKYSR